MQAGQHIDARSPKGANRAKTKRAGTSQNRPDVELAWVRINRPVLTGGRREQKQRTRPRHKACETTYTRTHTRAIFSHITLLQQYGPPRTMRPTQKNRWATPRIHAVWFGSEAPSENNGYDVHTAYIAFPSVTCSSRFTQPIVPAILFGNLGTKRVFISRSVTATETELTSATLVKSSQGKARQQQR